MPSNTELGVQRGIMDKTKYQEIGWAELKVDCYTGEKCDQHKSEWHGHFDGDRDGGKIGGEITLGANAFTPGTKIVIKEPVCPECDCPRSVCVLEEDCLFDWKAWDEEQYA